MNLLKIIFILLVLFPSFALAEKKVRSVGHLSCGEFLSFCDKDKLQLNCQTQTFYVEGYISGISWEYNIPVNNFNSNSIKYALIKFCRNNPLKDTAHGANNILNQLK